MSAPRPLVVFLVQGIGPQGGPQAQNDFLARLREATIERLAQRGRAEQGSRLVMERADWSNLFPKRQAWLTTLFASHTSRWTRPGWSLAMLLTDSVSDVILYGSEGPRQQIIDVVLNKLQPYLQEKYTLGQGAQECLPVLFIGHSLGTVVAYDLLLGISARMRGRVTAVQRQLTTVNYQLQALASAPPASRAGVGDGSEDIAVRRIALQRCQVFLQRAKQVEDVVCPLGMVTLGSPIAFFIFRKPTLLDRTNLWEEACPVAFETSGSLGVLRWRWQNFWHPSDMVAQRLEPLFNDGYPRQPSGASPRPKFVEDVKIWAWARGPLSAHSTYLTNPAVLRRISEHVADVLVSLP